MIRKKCRNLFVNALSGKRVVEIECGPGGDANYLSSKGLEVTATDFCDDFLSIVRESYPHITTHKMDMTQPDLPACSYDGIYAFASFQHLPRKQAPQTLRGFRKILREPGVLFLSLVSSTKRREYVLEGWEDHPGKPLLFTCYQEGELEALLIEAGFSRVEFHYLGSEIYEKLPILVEQGLSHYQALAFTC